MIHRLGVMRTLRLKRSGRKCFLPASLPGSDHRARRRQHLLHGLQYGLFFIRREADLQFFSSVRGMYLKSKNAPSVPDGSLESPPAGHVEKR